MRLSKSLLPCLAFAAACLLPTTLRAQIMMVHTLENQSKATWTVEIMPMDEDDEEEAPVKKPTKGKADQGDPKLLFASLQVMEGSRQQGIVKVPGSQVNLLPGHKYEFRYHMPENKKVTKGTDSLAMPLGLRDTQGNVFPLSASVFDMGAGTLKVVSGFPFKDNPSVIKFEPAMPKAEVQKALPKAFGGMWNLIGPMVSPLVNGPSLAKFTSGNKINENLGNVSIKANAVR